VERREFIALAGIAAALMPQRAEAYPKHPDPSIAALVGSWTFVSSTNTRKDGTTFDRWGPSPTGIFMFDRGGNYSQIIIGSESRVFGAKTFCAFGTYKMEEGRKLLVTHISSCSASRLIGTTQNREVLLLTEDEFKYSNSVTSLDATAEVLWKRIA
jgi:hypothetical protein